MKFLNKLTIRKKIFLIVSVSQILAIAALVAGYAGIYVLNDSINKMYCESVAPSENLRELQEYLDAKIKSNVLELKQGGGNFDKLSKELENSDAKMDSKLDALRAISLTNEEKTLFGELEKNIKSTSIGLKELEKAAKNKDFAALLDYAESDMPYSIDPSLAAINKMMLIELTKSQTLYMETTAAYALSLFIPAVVYLSGALLVGLLVFFVIKSMLKAVDGLQFDIARISKEKDLTVDKTSYANDEISQISNGFFELLRNMRNVIADAKDSSSKNAQISAELSATADQIGRIDLS